MISLLLAVSCEREDPIRTYQAPKQSPPDLPSWSVPAGWRSLPSQAMRFATFKVDPNDTETILTVIRLGPEAGQLLPNVNRWENQLGLPPSKAEELAKVMKQIEVAGMPVVLVDLQAERQRTLAAIVPRSEKIWFFKLSGGSDVVARQQENFEAFVESVRFGHQDESTQPSDAPWKVPQGWVEEGPRPMRVATFRTSQDPNAAELVITRFAADSFGGMLDNINRWRGMVGLEPVNHEKDQPVEKITVSSKEGQLFDMTGPAKDGQPPRRLRLAMVRNGQTVWFFRLIGPADVVEQQDANFKAFLESVRFSS